MKRRKFFGVMGVNSSAGYVSPVSASQPNGSVTQAADRTYRDLLMDEND